MYVPALSLLDDSVHEPLPFDRLITHKVVVDFFTATLPVAVVPRNSGDTVTETRSACSSP